jgi:hypothetical protein
MALFRKEKKVTLTRTQAMAVSAILELARLECLSDVKTIRGLEDIIDTQIWGNKYVDYRRSVIEQNGNKDA